MRYGQIRGRPRPHSKEVHGFCSKLVWDCQRQLSSQSQSARCPGAVSLAPEPLPQKLLFRNKYALLAISPRSLDILTSGLGDVTSYRFPMIFQGQRQGSFSEKFLTSFSPLRRQNFGCPPASGSLSLSYYEAKLHL